MNIAGERGNVSGPYRDGAMDPASGELGAEEVWQEPVDRLLIRLATTRTGLASTEVQSRLATHGPKATPNNYRFRWAVSVRWYNSIPDGIHLA